MTEAALAISTRDSSHEAGQEIAGKIVEKFGEKAPHAVLVFSSSRYNYQELLTAIKISCSPEVLIGCSSAGEFIRGERQEGAVCALALRSEDLKFKGGLATNLSGDKKLAAQQMVSSFRGHQNNEHRYHTAIVLADALAGYTDDFIRALTLETGGRYQLVGGGAGDDANFRETEVFFGSESYKNAAVALEILSNEPVGIGVQHGWEPASEPMRVTEANGSCLLSLDAVPAVEVFEEYAAKTNQGFDREDPVPFFLHNVIGIQTNNGYKLRVPLSLNPDGSLGCASDVPEGSTICLMRTTNDSSVSAAMTSAQAALLQMNGITPKVGIFFDCVATRLRMGMDFEIELDSFTNSLAGTDFVGCNTYGQIARVEGQFSGFHNCTAVTCLLP